ncbi:MAG: hypothetical protein C4297_11415 [Gemmataceae bacterium]
MTTRLLLVPKHGGACLPLNRPVTLIGRHHDCDIQLESRKVSRRHCCIALINGQPVLRDLSSLNGTRVNGERIRERQLHPGDVVSIANVVFQVICSEDGSEPPEMAAGEKLPLAVPSLPAAQDVDPALGQPVSLKGTDAPAVPGASQPAQASPAEPQWSDDIPMLALDGIEEAPSGQAPHEFSAPADADNPLHDDAFFESLRQPVPTPPPAADR